MLSPKVKGLVEGFVTGSIAASILYTILLNAGYIVSVEGVRAIADEKLKPLKDNVDTILLLQLEGRMRSLAQEQCTAGSTLQAVLQSEIDRLQKQHFDIAKVYYTISIRCDSGVRE